MLWVVLLALRARVAAKNVSFSNKVASLGKSYLENRGHQRLLSRRIDHPIMPFGRMLS